MCYVSFGQLNKKRLLLEKSNEIKCKLVFKKKQILVYLTFDSICPSFESNSTLRQKINIYRIKMKTIKIRLFMLVSIYSVPSVLSCRSRNDATFLAESTGKAPDWRECRKIKSDAIILFFFLASIELMSTHEFDGGDIS